MTASPAGPRISVFLPSHEHASTLPYAVRSVQAQGVQDMEILICGDGVTEDVRATVLALQRDDPRIRFFDLPKAPARGELNRDHVLRQARGEFVFHQNDDDLWLPGHIDMLGRALADADFVGSIQVNVGPDDKVRTWFFDLERPEFVEPWLAWQPNDFGPWACNGFGPVFAAHRRDAYLRLPEGWTTTPEGLPADQFLWHKFLRQPWCRARLLRWPTALHFHSPERLDWSPEQRADELRRWTAIIEGPDYAVRIWRDLLPDLGDRLLGQALDGRKARHDMIAAYEASIARLEAELAALRRELAALRRELAAAQAGRLDEYGKRLAREKDLNDVLSSTSWKLTAPLRAAMHRLLRRGR
ncbi:MAG: glycosyltransferase [Alphaproteobacteria bacterium]|nr:glycosyltransferase [Alphaproteobacteria bacterium]